MAQPGKPPLSSSASWRARPPVPHAFVSTRAASCGSGIELSEDICPLRRFGSPHRRGGQALATPAFRERGEPAHERIQRLFRHRDRWRERDRRGHGPRRCARRGQASRYSIATTPRTSRSRSSECRFAQVELRDPAGGGAGDRRRGASPGRSRRARQQRRGEPGDGCSTPRTPTTSKSSSPSISRARSTAPRRRFPTCKARGGGAIVNLASIAGKNISLGADIPYTVTKWGMVGFSRGTSPTSSLRGESGPIRSSPGRPAPGSCAATSRTDRGRGSARAPRRAGRTSRTPSSFFLSPRAAMCTGAELVVDGGILLGSGHAYEEYFREARRRAPRPLSGGYRDERRHGPGHAP